MTIGGFLFFNSPVNNPKSLENRAFAKA